MSRHDAEPDSDLESTVELSDKAEAEALRRELIEFLKTPDAQRDIQAILLTPLKKAVNESLLNREVQDQLRAQIIQTLAPSLLKVAKDAASDALRNVQLLPDDRVMVDALRRKAEQTLKDAFVKAQEEALAVLPKLVEQTRKEVRQHLEKATREAAAEAKRQPGEGGNTGGSVYYPASPGSWRTNTLRTVAVLGIVAVIIYIVYLFFAPRRQEPPIDGGQSTDTAVDYGNYSASTAESARSQDTEPPALYKKYEAALGRLSAKLPVASSEQLQCVESAIRASEAYGGGSSYLRKLQDSLSTCAAAKSPPSGASRLVAAVQQELNDAKRTCSQLPAVGVDGIAGPSTQKALEAYVSCTNPEGFPSQLTTLADYATVGVYFVYTRDQDGP